MAILTCVADNVKYKIKNTTVRWKVHRMVGGVEQLLRIHGGQAKNYFAATGEWPRGVVDDELFDIIWLCHHTNGHVKTAQTLNKMLWDEGTNSECIVCCGL
jgi:hypothetical protein